MINPAISGSAPRRPAHPTGASTASLFADSDSPMEQVGSELARELRRRWHGGERVRAEEILSAHPQLAEQAEAAVELIYEEYCLREAAGDGGAEQDILDRFPQWSGPLKVMLDCHRRVLQAQRDRPRFPVAGERVGGFQLLAELARGAGGRVFRATQPALADRPVVLKITPLDGAEHLSLARLQHTNIVPLYSVLDDVARNVRVLCMPYFGCATLASLIESVADVPPAARTGRHVVAVIDRMRDAGAAEPAALAGAARQMLENVSYVQAVCWITACLCDALQYAHERGLVHLDLKPSNVLLASDGQPMLLDFHLAREPVRPDAPVPGNIGGTPPYMPPEQQAAMRALQDSRPVEAIVDGRADVFALGAMLYETLGGRLPLKTESPPLGQLNAHVSKGLSDVVAKCVAARAEDRYPEARDLAEDLRRHLTDQPLIGVTNRSVTERWEKWRRRRPSTLRAAGMVLVVGGALAALCASGWLHVRRLHDQAKLALYEGQRQLHREESAADAARTLERGVRVLDGVPFSGRLRQRLGEELVSAQRLHLARQLHELADEVRVLYGSDAIPPGHVQPLASACQRLWEQRDAVMASLERAQDPKVAEDLQDIAIFAAHLQRRLPPAAAAAPAEADRQAARLLDEAQATFGPSPVLAHERQLHGLPPAAASERPAAPSGGDQASPRKAWEHWALGRAFLASDELSRAAQELATARRLDPGGRWPNFYYGLSAYRTNRHEEAVAAFSTCIGTAPNVAGFFYNRALAHAALGRAEQALHDYDRALQLEPTHAAAALNRGMTHFAQKRLPEAIADLNLALKHGADAATVHYDLALIHAAANDRALALQHARRALASDPAHERARQLRDAFERNAGG